MLIRVKRHDKKTLRDKCCQAKRFALTAPGFARGLAGYSKPCLEC